MQSFLADQAVRTDFALSDLGFTTITSVEYEVVDQESAVVVSRGALAGYTPGALTATVQVDAEDNALSAGATAGARSVVIYVTGTGAAAGIASMSRDYAIVVADRLPVPGSSFQNLAGANLVAMDMVNVDYFSEATDPQKVAALIDAHFRICRMSYRFVPTDWQSRVNTKVEYFDLDEITLSEWQSMDQKFKTALKRAQLLEANDILANGDSMSSATLRDEGVTSIKIGASSRTFQKVGRSKSSLCSRAMTLLAPYLGPLRTARA